MEFKELQTKSVTELHRLLAEAREKMRQLRFKDAGKQLSDVRAIRRERQLVAWILTLINKNKKS